eukprot:CAMPEP_0114316038 /NCGR_PEP_ID=MMETSP0059-20121206/22957_1 /TAXON_ID=36894 /ORGANISM="Pyramimonas parkeae, Strain CCMP726" /LENGTH=358 /DNA_ID=CAMNT_0001441877 /DNA_START=79 /DNA_END=1152 /DNA_ORIENTATION=+
MGICVLVICGLLPLHAALPSSGGATSSSRNLATRAVRGILASTLGRFANGESGTEECEPAFRSTVVESDVPLEQITESHKPSGEGEVATPANPIGPSTSTSVPEIFSSLSNTVDIPSATPGLHLLAAVTTNNSISSSDSTSTQPPTTHDMQTNNLPACTTLDDKVHQPQRRMEVPDTRDWCPRPIPTTYASWLETVQLQEPGTTFASAHCLVAQEASGALGALAEADQKPPSSLSAPEESPRPGTGTRPKKSNVTRQILTLDEYKKNIAEKAKEAGKAKSGAAGRGDETSSTMGAESAHHLSEKGDKPSDAADHHSAASFLASSQPLASTAASSFDTGGVGQASASAADPDATGLGAA